MEKKDQKFLDEIDLIGELLEDAWTYDLHLEVIASTIREVRANPDIELSVALHNALKEWDL